MLCISEPYIHRAVDAGAGIPAAVRLVPILGDHADLIVFAVFQELVQRDIEICIPVGTERSFFSVYIHFRIVVNAFKLKDGCFFFPFCRHGQNFRIFIIPADVPADVSFALAFLRPRLIDHRVMRKIYSLRLSLSAERTYFPIIINAKFSHPDTLPVKIY